MSTKRKHTPRTRHQHHGGSRHLHERYHRASRPSCVSYLTPKHPGSRTTVRRTPGLPVSTMLRDAQKCASVTEQAQRIGRPAAPAPHGLRRGMSSAYPCCSHDVRQRGYVRVLAWQPPNARRGLLDLAQEGPIPCESEACPEEKLYIPADNLNW